MPKNQSGAVLRRAKVSDANALLALLKRLERETPFFPWLPDERSLTAADLEERIASATVQDRLILLADHGGKTAGYVDIRRAGLQRLAHGASLELGVRKASWGAGIGRALMQAAEEWARKRGVLRIGFPVVSENLRAIGLYLRLGYTIEGCRRGVYRIDDRLVDEYLFAKQLEGNLPHAKLS